MIRLFDGPVESLSRGLQFASRRHEVIVQNLANLETPGYRGRDLVFEDHLRPLREVPAPELGPALPPVGPDERQARLILARDGAVKPGGSDVHVDRQMARLAENTLFHNALTQVLINRFTAMKQAISGRL